MVYLRIQIKEICICTVRSAMFLVLVSVVSHPARAQGVISSTLNPSQVATLHWYGANQASGRPMSTVTR
jgi:hypothetical protein